MKSRLIESARLAAFRWLLQHSSPADLPRYIPPLAAWLSRYGRINEALIKPGVYRLFQQHGFDVVPHHYYSVLPDAGDLPDSWWQQAPYQEAYDRIRKSPEMDALFERVLSWSGELAAIPRDSTSGFFWNNPMLPPLDALVIYGLIRELRPRLYLEVGSGYSTEIALLAAQNTGTAIRCIEPYPGRHLLRHAGQLQELRREPLQQVPEAVFEELQAGDFLFIDSTHTVKVRSDVNHLMFRVLPRLAPGVIVHVHDIFLPEEYPQRWYDELSIFFNEQYLLLAYLMENPHAELLLPNHDLSRRHAAELRERLKDFDIWSITENLGGASGAGCWFRRL